MARTRAGAARRGSLVAVSAPANEPSRAERELSALLGRLSELEAETASISESLARFRDERRARLAAAESQLHTAKRLEERLVRLAREAEEWAAGPAAAEPKKRRRPSRSALPPLPTRSLSEDDAAPWLPLKELYRSLARKLHPDFATTDPERARRSELMARVNAAYAREDRVLLELLHEEAESDSWAAEPSSERRAGHAERRLATIAPMVAALEKGLARLRASSSFKDLEAARRAAERGGDFFGEAAYATRKAARESLRKALLHAERLDETLRVYRARSIAPPARGARRKAQGDAWPGERLLRAAARPDQEPVTDESRRVASRLEALAASHKWQVVLSLFALFAEVSPEPPPALSTFADVRASYEVLCAADPSAPTFDRALVDLPPHLEVGMRSYPRRLVFGIQAKRREQLAGLRLALDSAACKPIARAVLAVMGPLERCDGCRESQPLVHVFRARGIDEVHALSCPACGALHRSYRSFGAPAGLEALAPYAVALGLVVEQPVAIGTSTVVLGLLQKETRRLDTRFLVDRVATLLLDELSPELREYAQLTANRKVLPPSARIHPGMRLRLTMRKGAPLSMKELERELLLRARSRFRVRSRSGRSRGGS
jgi:hypothetical protein